ncbi:hypothetical protein C5167_048772 [Papaver somniferum]|uniref:2'-phosphotransferase n=1 Tax=Papaver somniferum TaxID=3469 RepID=A0A4Y7KKB2_PAPSO|nr:hypothetical protein C5167_048772 [Papaver somniferum]
MRPQIIPSESYLLVLSIFDGGSGRGSNRGTQMRDGRGGGRGGGGGGGRGGGRGGEGGRGGGADKIDALGRLLSRVLRHMAEELGLNMRSDGYVKVDDLLKLDIKTFANIPLKSHTIDDIREAVRRDNKQRHGLLEENGELLIRANQGHTIKCGSRSNHALQSLIWPGFCFWRQPCAKQINDNYGCAHDLIQIMSRQLNPRVCVHATYKRNLESILKNGLKRMERLHVHFSSGMPTDGEVISGMRRDVSIMIFLDVGKALKEGMKFYISENKVILTEGFKCIVPVKYIMKIETWPGRQPVPF